MNEGKGKGWPRYAFYSLIVIAVLLIILVLFLYLIKSPLIFNSGAETLITTTSVEPSPATAAVSLDNSYVFASPLRAATGGEKIRITVFVLDSRGLGITGKTVSLGGGDLLQVTPIQPATDGQGRATFDVSSNTSGAYIITASTDGTKLVQQATISFD